MLFLNIKLAFWVKNSRVGFYPVTLNWKDKINPTILRLTEKIRYISVNKKIENENYQWDLSYCNIYARVQI